MQNYNWRIALLDLFVLSSWTVVLFDAYFQAKEIPLMIEKYPVPAIPIPIILAGMVLVPIGIAIGSFWQRKRIMEELPVVSRLMDKWFFEDAYAFFMRRLHAVYASIASTLLFGLVGIHVTHSTTQNLLSYGIFTGSVFFSVCMIFAVAASRRYPPLLQ